MNFMSTSDGLVTLGFQGAAMQGKHTGHATPAQAHLQLAPNVGLIICKYS